MRLRFLAMAVVAALATLAPPRESCAVRPGETAPSARAATVGGKVLDVRALRGKLAVIWYEDEASARLNTELKDAIRAQGAGPGHKDGVQIYAVANVSGYDWWPARSFVKDAILKEERKSGYDLYLDWSGDFRTALGFQDGTSNIVVVDPEGVVRVFHAGKVPTALRDEILALIAR